MTVTYRTVVLDVPPSPLGLIPGRLVIQHHCNLCHAQVATDNLASHTRAHDHQDVNTKN